ncbi:hypothetical protein COLO4_31430 [Corchorus olitorius]|uniref:Uncharacterized protein n=1 Tax=Corchorus olitorius TaxID=93759 RepID=A0A1R3H4D5_9ROSI|nr:hypothetical protein COLO4_31430 [Corchorus olitorius]
MAVEWREEKKKELGPTKQQLYRKHADPPA